jgi:hypothetical protein
MLSWDEGRTLADRFRSHAGKASHLYGHAMRGMADDWEAGGPVRTICAGYEHTWWQQLAVAGSACSSWAPVPG